jgi:hypothetical protein
VRFWNIHGGYSFALKPKGGRGNRTSVSLPDPYWVTVQDPAAVGVISNALGSTAINWTDVTIPEGGTVSKIRVHIGTRYSAGTVKAALYSEGSSLLSSGQADHTSTGWLEIPITEYVVSAGTYKISWEPSNFQADFSYLDATGSFVFATLDYADFPPADLPVGNTLSRSYCVGIYLAPDGSGAGAGGGGGDDGITNYYPNSLSRSDVGATYALMADGDTMYLPTGNVEWTTGIKITKAINIIGSGAGQTIIQNGIPDSMDTDRRHVFYLSLVSGKNTRLSNVEIRSSPSQLSNIFSHAVMVEGVNTYKTSDTSGMARIDHCKFYDYRAQALRIESALGVCDHCEFTGPTIAVYGYHRYFSGTAAWADGYGDGSWAAPINFGSDQFWFIEDCTIHYTGQQGAPSGHYTMVDGYAGWRYVVRKSLIKRGSLEGHGAEIGGRARGTRGAEIYQNTFSGNNGGGLLTYLRSGPLLIHNNYITGYNSPNTNASIVNLRSVDEGTFGGASGNSVWDKNLAGGPFFTGTAGTSGRISELLYTIGVSGAAWTTNQWSGYSVQRLTNIGNQSGNSFSIIKSNTSNTLVYSPSIFGEPTTLNISSGDRIEIWKAVNCLDQCGMDSGSLITGNPAVPPVDWPNQTIHGCYSWNNTGEAGESVGIEREQSSLTIVEGVHFFNNTQKSGYTPYTYPHPLTLV